jgi:hypothetical protein
MAREKRDQMCPLYRVAILCSAVYALSFFYFAYIFDKLLRGCLYAYIHVSIYSTMLFVAVQYKDNTKVLQFRHKLRSESVTDS